MNVVYTRHARNRMRWRGISKGEVEEALTYPEKIEESGSHRFHYYRRIKKRYIRVTCVEENNELIIITVIDKND